MKIACGGCCRIATATASVGDDMNWGETMRLRMIVVQRR